MHNYTISKNKNIRNSGLVCLTLLAVPSFHFIKTIFLKMIFLVSNAKFFHGFRQKDYIVSSPQLNTSEMLPLKDSTRWTSCCPPSDTSSLLGQLTPKEPVSISSEDIQKSCGYICNNTDWDAGWWNCRYNSS